MYKYNYNLIKKGFNKQFDFLKLFSATSMLDFKALNWSQVFDGTQNVWKWSPLHDYTNKMFWKMLGLSFLLHLGFPKHNLCLVSKTAWWGIRFFFLLKRVLRLSAWNSCKRCYTPFRYLLIIIANRFGELKKISKLVFRGKDKNIKVKYINILTIEQKDKCVISFCIHVFMLNTKTT